MSKLTFGLLACVASLSTAVYAQCGAVIKKADPALKVVRSGGLVGDGSQEYIAVRLLTRQPKKGMYISRLVIVRAMHGHCSILLDAGKNGPRNPVGYVGIGYIDDGDGFYGYLVEFNFDANNPKHRSDIGLTWLNPEHEPEGLGIGVGWNEKVGRYQEYRLEDDNSPDIFKPEIRNPPHHNSKNCPKLCGNRK
jgi:hypothetical protein